MKAVLKGTILLATLLPSGAASHETNAVWSSHCTDISPSHFPVIQTTRCAADLTVLAADDNSSSAETITNAERVEELLQCQLQQAEGDPTEEAERCLARLGYHPSTSSDWNNQGWSRYLGGRHQEAVTDFSKALELDDKNEKARINRANAYSELGRRKEALEDIDYILKSDASSFNGLENKCLLYIAWDKTPKALPWCDKAVTLYPDNSIGLSNRGFAYLRSGEYRLAIADFEKSITLSHEFETAISNLDHALSELGDDELWQTVYRRLRNATGDDRWSEEKRLSAKAESSQAYKEKPMWIMQDLMDRQSRTEGQSDDRFDR